MLARIQIACILDANKQQNIMMDISMHGKGNMYMHSYMDSFVMKALHFNLGGLKLLLITSS